MGYAYWLLPALFFKLFGPYLYSLVLAQVFINIVAGAAFITIIRTLVSKIGVLFLSVLVFCLSYSFINFWPWYNHTVIVYQLVGLAFLLQYIFRDKYRWGYLVAASFFLFFSLFTKQDGGGLAFLISVALLVYESYAQKTLKPLLLFLVFYAIIACLFILPLLSYNFEYWFNYGQSPHYSRVAIYDFLSDILGQSQWEKFYLLVIGLVLITKLRNFPAFLHQKKDVVFLLLTVGILVEALLFQVTSYVPPNNNIFFHSFACAYILSNVKTSINFAHPALLALASLLVFLWWSGSYWQYLDRVVERIYPKISQTGGSNQISKNSWNQGQDSSRVDLGPWVFSDIPVFRRVYMPQKTVQGIQRVMELPIVKEKGKTLNMLNMTELTPLARSMGYLLPTGVNQPLWYHKGVSVFDQQVDQYCENIRQQQYDIVMFEYLDGLNNFYPFQVRDFLRKHYRLVDTFPAPRSDGYAPIEVYVR